MVLWNKNIGEETHTYTHTSYLEKGDYFCSRQSQIKPFILPLLAQEQGDKNKCFLGFLKAVKQASYMQFPESRVPEPFVTNIRQHLWQEFYRLTSFPNSQPCDCGVNLNSYKEDGKGWAKHC